MIGGSLKVITNLGDVLAGTHKQNLPEFLSELVLPVWYSNRQPTEFNQYQKTRQI